MRMKHYALLGACLAAIGTMGSASHDWGEILSPKFVFGAISQVGLLIGAMYTERPNEKRVYEDDL